jgi:hypothetical protein
MSQTFFFFAAHAFKNVFRPPPQLLSLFCLFLQFKTDIRSSTALYGSRSRSFHCEFFLFIDHQQFSLSLLPI